MGKRLYVGNLTYDVADSELQSLFEQFGTVESAQVVQDRNTGRSKGFGFVEMSTQEEADASIAALNGKDHKGRSRPFTESELQGLLQNRVHDGTVRVVASKILEGEILGPARFKRYQDCTELRALKVAYAWVNNIDTKDHNSLLVWDGQRTVGYLIDFGTSLGADAGSGGPKSQCAGWTNIVDLKEGSVKLLTLGLVHTSCDTAQPVSVAIGRFSPKIDPDRWKPYAPNIAFLDIDDEDADWIARRISRLSHEQIEAAVAAGQYSNPQDAAYLVKVLEERQQAIVERYLDDESEAAASTAVVTR